MLMENYVDDCKGVFCSCAVIWPPSTFLGQEIISYLRKQQRITSANLLGEIDVDEKMLLDIMRKVYEHDWIPMRICEEKWSIICNHEKGKKLKLQFISLDIMHNCEDGEELIASAVKGIKTDVRNYFIPYIKNYEHDIIIHIADSYEQVASIMTVCNDLLNR